MRNPEAALPKQVRGWVHYVNGSEGLNRPRRFPDRWHVVYELFVIELVRLLLGIQVRPWATPRAVRYDTEVKSIRAHDSPLRGERRSPPYQSA